MHCHLVRVRKPCHDAGGEGQGLRGLSWRKAALKVVGGREETALPWWEEGGGHVMEGERQCLSGTGKGGLSSH